MTQEAPGLSFESFQEWMKSAKVPGYRLMECEKDGVEYTASFMGAKPEKLLMVRCGTLASFGEVRRLANAVQGLKEGTLSGLRTSRYSMASMPILQIELKAKSCTLTLGGGEGMPPAELDKLASALKLGERAQ